MWAIRQYNIDAFNDQFFVAPPAWFSFYIVMEITHIPAVIFGIYGLITQHPQTPLVMLVYALHTATTTATCIADMLHWDPKIVSKDEKIALLGTYGPYCAIACYMTADCVLRISKVLRRDSGSQVAKKRS
jgi:hypothetical protein